MIFYNVHLRAVIHARNVETFRVATPYLRGVELNIDAKSCWLDNAETGCNNLVSSDMLTYGLAVIPCLVMTGLAGAFIYFRLRAAGKC